MLSLPRTMAPASSSRVTTSRVLVRNAVGVHGAPGRGQHARRIDVVLQRDRNAVQRATPLPPGEFLPERPRARRGPFAGHGDEGVEALVEAPDALDVRLHQLERRKRAGTNQPLGFGDAQRRRIGGLGERRTAQRVRGGGGGARRQELTPVDGSCHVSSPLHDAIPRRIPGSAGRPCRAGYGSARAISSAGSPRSPIATAMYCFPSTL